MAISFSGSAKAEICRAVSQKTCCARALCFGVLLFCNSFSADGIRIVTECRDLAALLPKLFRKAFGVHFDVLPEADAQGKLVFAITDDAKLSVIMDSFGFGFDSFKLIHEFFVYMETACCVENNIVVTVVL